MNKIHHGILKYILLVIYMFLDLINEYKMEHIKRVQVIYNNSPTNAHFFTFTWLFILKQGKLLTCFDPSGILSQKQCVWGE